MISPKPLHSEKCNDRSCAFDVNCGGVERLNCHEEFQGQPDEKNQQTCQDY